MPGSAPQIQKLRPLVAMRHASLSIVWENVCRFDAGPPPDNVDNVLMCRRLLARSQRRLRSDRHATTLLSVAGGNPSQPQPRPCIVRAEQYENSCRHQSLITLLPSLCLVSFRYRYARNDRTVVIDERPSILPSWIAIGQLGTVLTE